MSKLEPLKPPHRLLRCMTVGDCLIVCFLEHHLGVCIPLSAIVMQLVFKLALCIDRQKQSIICRAKFVSFLAPLNGSCVLCRILQSGTKSTRSGLVTSSSSVLLARVLPQCWKPSNQGIHSSQDTLIRFKHTAKSVSSLFAYLHDQEDTFKVLAPWTVLSR